MKIRLILFLGLCTFGSLRAQTTPSHPLKLETGFNYSRGDYGLPQDTEVTAIPVGLAYEGTTWTFRGTIPWLTIKGPASVIEGGGVPIRPTADSQSGFGDFVGALTGKFASGPDQAMMSLTGRVKLPMGNADRGLSTGERDYYAQFDVLKTFGSVTPFATGGYRWLGRNERFPLRDGFFASGGLAVRVADGTSIGAAYEWRDRIVDGSEDANEVSVFFFRKISDRWNLTLTAMKGFTDASANYGFGGSLVFSF